MRETTDKIFFLKSYLSNFYACNFKELGIVFNCTEQYFMYYKAKTFNDIETAKKILSSSSPFEIKSLGRSVKNYDDKVWANIRYDVMFRGNLHKFYQNPKLNDKLQDTGYKTLVEANPNDCIWGVGLSEDDDLILDEKNWNGLNLLGKCLMQVRDDLR